MAPAALPRQTDSFLRAVESLLESCRMRDREAIRSHGLTPNQWYALRALEAGRKLPMRELAHLLGLTPSGATRLTETLVARGLVIRYFRREDRRVCCVGLSEEGGALVRRHGRELRERARSALRRLPAPQRESVLSAIRELVGSPQGKEAQREMG